MRNSCRLVCSVVCISVGLSALQNEQKSRGFISIELMTARLRNHPASHIDRSYPRVDSGFPHDGHQER